MSYFNKENIIQALVALGKYIQEPDEKLNLAINLSTQKNSWFTKGNVSNALHAISRMLQQEALEQWLSRYEFSGDPKKIGLVLAGNIPMVGFHDVLSTLLSGNIALIKLSSNDDVLMTTILDKLTELEPALSEQIKIVHKLENFDAVIATGSNNTSRYFEYYFSKVPHIIRKNRNSIAVLTGNETVEDFKALARDIFDYFGLGCRNVSKLYVPEAYNFIPFLDAIEEFNTVLDHHKYKNNYDYNKSIYLINKVEHLDNGFLLVSPNTSLISPLSVLFYENYSSLEALRQELENKSEEIQVVVSDEPLNIAVSNVGFGESQQPKLWDYADGVDTMQFLTSLGK